MSWKEVEVSVAPIVSYTATRKMDQLLRLVNECIRAVEAEESALNYEMFPC